MDAKIHAISIHEAGHAEALAHSRFFRPLAIHFGNGSARVESCARKGVPNNTNLEVGLPAWERIEIAMAGYVANQVQIARDKIWKRDDPLPPSFIENGLTGDLTKWCQLNSPLVDASEIDSMRDAMWSDLCVYFASQQIWTQVQAVAELLENEWNSLKPSERGLITKKQVFEAIDGLSLWEENEALPIPSVVMQRCQ